MRSDLELHVSLRKLACVLDPSLLLCHAQGPMLAQRLTQVLEPWVTRSFWQAIDASEWLLAPAGNAAAGSAHAEPEARGSIVCGSALNEWLALRETTEAGSWLLRWIGDCFAESRLHDDADTRVVERWEHWAQALAQRVEARDGARARGAGARWHGFDPSRAALDALALSATLDGALLLCASHDEPAPVRAARDAGLGVARLEPIPSHSLFDAERVVLRQALAGAGLAPMLEARLPLCAAHVLTAADAAAVGGDAAAGADDAMADPWSGARLCWYAV